MKSTVVLAIFLLCMTVGVPETRAQEVTVEQSFSILRQAGFPGPSIAVPEAIEFEVPDGVTVDSMRVTVVGTYNFTASSANGIIASDFQAEVSFYDSGQTLLDGVVLATRRVVDDSAAGATTRSGTFRKERLSWNPQPQPGRCVVRLLIAPDLSQQGSGSLTGHVFGTVSVTFNPDPERLVCVYDATDTELLREVSTVTLPADHDISSPVGSVQDVTGVVTVTRSDGTTVPAEIGMPVYQYDLIETGAGSAVNLVFIDETSFAISAQARLVIDEYVFDPATNNGDTHFNVLKGLFVWTSGLIAREDPDDVHIETPIGSIGIRASAEEYTGVCIMCTTGSPSTLWRAFVPPRGIFQISLDYLMLDRNGELTVSLNDDVLRVLRYDDMNPSTNGFERLVISVNGDNYAPFRPVELRLTIDGPADSRVLIDNVTGPGFTSPDFSSLPRNGAGGWSRRGPGTVELAATVVDRFCVGTAEFSPAVESALPLPTTWLSAVDRACVGDLNNDGIRDIAVIIRDVVQEAGVLRTMLGDGFGAFLSAASIQLRDYNVRDIALVDLDLDGNRDAIIHYGVSGFDVVPGNGDGSWGTPIEISDTEMASVRPIDTNGDGRLDLVSLTVDASSMLSYYETQPGGGYSLSRTESLDGLYGALAVADFDDDGRDDLAVVGWGSVSTLVYYGSDVQELSNPTEVELGGVPYGGVFVGDVNRDGLPDLISSLAAFFEGAPLLAVATSMGADGFAMGETFGSATEDEIFVFARIVVGDLNSDGRIDVLMPGLAGGGSSPSANIPAFFGDEDSLMVRDSVYIEGGRVLVASELNRDGAIDVLSWGYGDLGEGRLRFNANVCNDDPTCPADFDGNGAVGVPDIFAFLSAWFGQDPRADFDGVPGITVPDIFAFLSAWFAGCP